MKAEIRAMHLQVKECHEIDSNHQKLGERPGFPPHTTPTILRRNQLSRHLALALPASRTVRQSTSVAEATQSVVFCYSSLSK